MAVNCWVVAGTMLTFPGETVIETRRSCTASDAEPASEPEVAEITVVPEPALVAIPWEPDELPIMATAADEDAQVTDVVRFAVDPSVYRPVARNCSEPPIGMVVPCGLISMAARIPLVTVRLPDPDTPPKTALMTVFPLLVLETRPLLPDVLLTVATPGTDEVQ